MRSVETRTGLGRAVADTARCHPPKDASTGSLSLSANTGISSCLNSISSVQFYRLLRPSRFRRLFLHKRTHSNGWLHSWRTLQSIGLSPPLR